MFQFIREALSEDGKGSSKRLIAFISAIMLNFICGYATVWLLKHATPTNDGESASKWFAGALILFDLLLLGVATLPQLIKAFKAIKGVPETDPPAKEPEPAKKEVAE